MIGIIKNRVLSIVLSSMLLISLIPNTVSAEILDSSINLNNDNIVYVDFNENINDNLNNAIELVNEFDDNSEKDYTKLKEAIDIFRESHSTLNYEEIMKHEKNDQFDYIFYKIIDMMMVLNTSEANETVIYLSDSLYKTIAERKENGDKYNFTFENYSDWTYRHADSRKGLIYTIFNRKTSASVRASYGATLVLLSNDPFSGNPTEDGTVYDVNYIPSEHLYPGYEEYIPVYETPEIPKPSEGRPEKPEVDLPVILPGDAPQGDIPQGDIPQEGIPGSGDDDNQYIIVYYEKQGNDCYKITQEFKNGKLTEKSVLADKSEYKYCDIYDYEGEYDIHYTYGEYSEVIIDGKYNNDKQLSDNTLQFTLEKNKGEKAYYYDTSIRVTEDEKVEFKTLKNVYKFIASNINSEYIKDGDAVMTIIDGKPYYLNEKGSEYTKEEIESLFDKSDDVQVKIDKAKSRVTSSIEDESSVQKIMLNGKEIEFENKPLLEGSITIYPLKELSEKLGAKYNVEDKKITIEKDELNVIYYLETRRVVTNGQIREVTVNTELKNNVVYGQILDILNGLEFEYEVIGNDLKIKS